MFRILSYTLVLMLIPPWASAGASGTPAIGKTPGFFESWLRQETPATELSMPTIRFRFTESLTNALRDQDRALVRELLPLYAQALESEIQLSRLELSAKRELTGRARRIADQLHALSSFLDERPAAGPLGQIERETLAAAALPFEAAAAESLAKMAPLHRRLEQLGAKPDFTAIPEPPAPSAKDAASLAASSPALRIQDLLIDRHLASLGPLDRSSPTWEAIFLEGETIPPLQLTRLGQQGRFSPKTRTEMHGDAVYSLTEAIQRRLDAIAALQPVIRAFPEDRLARMLAAAELADRQYRQGAIPLNLLIETQRATFEALRARSEALLMLWRETLELQSLS